MPAGAIPKDGPSAGVTMATALASLISGRQVRDDTAMTGELTLTGQVLPIGGLKEKALAAQAAGIERVIAPKLNQQDIDDIPEHLRKDLEFIFVDRIEQVLDNALEPEPAGAQRRAAARRGPPHAPPVARDATATRVRAPRSRRASRRRQGALEVARALLRLPGACPRARRRRRAADAAGRSCPTSAMSRWKGRPTVQSITARTLRAVPGIWLTW